MSNHEAAERAFVAVQLDRMANRFEQARADMTDEITRLRESWSSGYAEELRETAARSRAEQDETRRYLAQLAGDGQAPAPIDPRQIPQDASGSGRGPATPAPGPGSAGHPLTDADIAAMSWAEYQAFRVRIGMGNASGRGLFG